MDSEIDDYWNDSNNNYKQDKFPGQSIEVGAFPLENIEDDKISQSNYYSNDNGGSSKKRYIHRRNEKINMLGK